MASEQIKQVLKAEERARQAELEAVKKAAEIRSQAANDALKIAANEKAAAENKTVEILKDTKQKADAIIEQAVLESNKERQQLRAGASQRWGKAVSSVVSAVIGQ